MKETAIRLREFAEDWANTPIDTDVDIRRLNVSLFLDQLMRIIDDGYMSNDLVNQEVEKRIARVMPTKNEIGNAAQLFDKQKRPLWKEAIWRAGANWAVDIICSRLTCSEKPNNLKTEGGTNDKG